MSILYDETEKKRGSSGRKKERKVFERDMNGRSCFFEQGKGKREGKNGTIKRKKTPPTPGMKREKEKKKERREKFSQEKVQNKTKKKRGLPSPWSNRYAVVIMRKERSC